MRESPGTGANLDVPGDIANYPVTVASQPDSALRDGIFIGANDVTLTFGGLNPNATYDFLLYGGRGNNGTGATYNFTGGNTGSASISNVFGNSTEAPTVVGITPDTNNEIKLDIPNVGGSNTALNFIQVTETVTAIPEPSSLFLCGLASLALFTRRRIS